MLDFPLLVQVSLASRFSIILVIVITGIMGVMGNKGGISIRFNLYDSSLCFICSHFHASRDNIVLRNQDFHSIFENSNFVQVDYESRKTEVELTDGISKNISSILDGNDLLKIRDHWFALGWMQ